MIDFEFEFQYAEEKTPALRQTGGSIPKGRCIVLCGGSGCGKSTLLRSINGLIPQFYEGELKGFCRLNGRDTAGLSIGEIGELAASVFQDPRSQFFTVNSSNEVAFGLENHGMPQEKIRRRVDEAFSVFHLERLKNRNVYELSSGERQLISILSAWALDTDIFLLDEPTANLDFAATQQLKNILLALKAQGKTLLLSEHRLYYLAGIADEYWVMAGGEIKEKYTADEAKALSQERLHELSLRTLDLDKIDVPERAQLPEAPTALSVSNIRYTYAKGADPILTGLSFSVREHEIVGLVGANGCGKTTIGKLIAGLYKPSGGTVSLFGKTQNLRQLQKQVLFIMQEAEFQFFTNSVLHELQYGHTVTPEFEERTENLLKSMGMWECRDRHPFSLSGGQMQKLTLMMAYLSDKPVIVLDEPTAGQDAESLERCAALIREMRRKKTDGTYGAACHPHCRDALRLCRDARHRPQAPKEQLLFTAIAKNNIRSAIIISSVTFGIGHIINIFNGSGMDLVSNLCQIVFAIAVGFLLVTIFYRGGSLIPCIIVHSAINTLGTFADDRNLTAEIHLLHLTALIVITVAYTLVLTRTLPESQPRAKQA